MNVETLAVPEYEHTFPAIRVIHKASSLADAGEVAAWRGAPPARTLPAPLGELVPLQPATETELPGDPLETVIVRRGSTRRFTREPLTFEQLSTTLFRALQGVPADYVEAAPNAMLGDVYLIVNAVEGLAPGAYVLHRGSAGNRLDLLTSGTAPSAGSGQALRQAHDERALDPAAVNTRGWALELLKAGDFRRAARHLALDQDLAGDAGVDVYVLTDLRPVLERFGNRGYRAAQLDASIAAGRIYLAAYAQRFGATGLTFYDDDVTEFFSPHAQGKCVMFLMALGKRVRRRRA